MCSMRNYDGLPPNREIKFEIELLPRTVPISNGQMWNDTNIEWTNLIVLAAARLALIPGSRLGLGFVLWLVETESTRYSKIGSRNNE